VVEVTWSKQNIVWEVVSASGARLYSRKVDAIKMGRVLAKHTKCELVVKNKNGRIAWRNSYGNDRRDRKG
jgi:hypothetical protein